MAKAGKLGGTGKKNVLQPASTFGTGIQSTGRTKPLFDLRQRLFTDPATVAAVAQAVLAFLEKQRADQAEQAFRTEVLARLDRIENELAKIRQDIALLGVRIIDALGQQTIFEAINDHFSILNNTYQNWDTALSRPQTASAEVGRLNTINIELTRFGFATCEHVMVGLYALYLLDRRSDRRRSDKRTLLRFYSNYLKQSLDPARVGSLAYQHVEIDKLTTEFRRRVARFTAPGRTRLGTSEGGSFEYFEDVSPEEDGYAVYTLSVVDHRRPERERIDRGPRGGRFLSEAGGDLVGSVTFATHANPIPDGDVILYTSGAITLASPEDIDNSYGHSGGDHWRSEHVDHVGEHMTTANKSVGLLKHLEPRLSVLGRTLQTAGRVDRWLDGVLQTM